jgi:hypothetical protein
MIKGLGCWVGCGCEGSNKSRGLTAKDLRHIIGSNRFRGTQGAMCKITMSSSFRRNRQGKPGAAAALVAGGAGAPVS